MSYKEVGERLGNNAYDFSAQLAEKSKQFACKIWGLYPDYVTNNQSLGASFARGFMNGLCGDNSPPPPYQGGNCPVPYYAFGTFYSKNTSSGGCDVTAYWRTATGLNGNDVSSWQPKVLTGDTRFAIKKNSGGHSFIIVISQANYTSRNTGFLGGTGISYRDKALNCISQTNNPLGDKIRVTDIVRADGQSGQCPPLHPVYPPSVPPDVISDNYTINIDDSTSLIYNVTLKKDGDNNFQFPLIFNWNDFDIGLDLGGFTFDLDLNFNPSPDDSDNPGNSPKPPILPPKETPPKGGDGDVKIYYYPLPPPDSLEGEEFYDETELPPEEETVEESVERLDYITVEVTQKPMNASRETGFPGDDIYYPGFAEFKSGGFNYPRVPLHFEKNILRAPDGANGYAVRLYNGFRGRIKVYTRKEQI